MLKQLVAGQPKPDGASEVPWVLLGDWHIDASDLNPVERIKLANHFGEPDLKLQDAELVLVAGSPSLYTAVPWKKIYDNALVSRAFNTWKTRDSFKADEDAVKIPKVSPFEGGPEFYVDMTGNALVDVRADTQPYISDHIPVTFRLEL